MRWEGNTVEPEPQLGQGRRVRDGTASLPVLTDTLQSQHSRMPLVLMPETFAETRTGRKMGPGASQWMVLNSGSIVVSLCVQVSHEQTQ